MTTARITTKPAPPAAIVRLMVSEQALKAMLRFDHGMRLAGADVENPGAENAVLVLYVEYPGAPPGADQLDPIYRNRDTSAADPVEFAGLRWYRGGIEVLPGA